ncbi:MAG: hypothetical protein KDB36_13745 [Acidimicrobiales bacterium]|nr:hypothetical protein [Acidimicrobiales bacterium]
MRAWRLPIIVVLLACIAGAVAYEQRSGVDEVTTAPSDLARLMPVVPGPGASRSTWFCAGGSATGQDDGVAEQTVTVLNAGDAASSVVLTAMTDTGARARRDVQVGPAERIDVPVSDLIEAEWAGVLVEADRPEVAVEHRVAGPGGDAVAACSSRAEGTWYVPSAPTRAGVRQLLVVFNPFPDDAVVDLRFETDDGTRTPEEYRPKLVRGGHVAVLDISASVTLREQVSAVLVARAGRVAVDAISIWDGTDDGPVGITLTPGAPAVAAQWLFAEGAPVAADQIQQLVAFNPDEEEADGEVIVVADGGEPIEPFAMVVRPEAYTVVDVAGDRRLPATGGYWADAAVYRGPAVAVGRLLSGGGGAPGISAGLGSPLVASRWLVPTAGLDGVRGNQLLVANPTAAAVTVQVDVLRDGRRTPLDDPVQIPAGARAVIDLGDVDDAERASIDLRADGAVVVEHKLATDDGFSVGLALPVDGTIAAPPAPEPPDVSAPVGTGLPPDIEVPGTTPGTSPGTVPGTTASVPVPSSDTTVAPAPAPSSTTAPTSVVPPG